MITVIFYSSFHLYKHVFYIAKYPLLLKLPLAETQLIHLLIGSLFPMNASVFPGPVNNYNFIHINYQACTLLANALLSIYTCTSYK